MVTRHVKDKNKGGWFSMSIDLDVQILFPIQKMVPLSICFYIHNHSHVQLGNMSWTANGSSVFQYSESDVQVFQSIYELTRVRKQLFYKFNNFYRIFLFKTLLFIYDSRASDFGLMKIDDKGRILSFSEKPKGGDLKAMVT